MTRVVKALVEKHGPFTLVSGGAKGADSMAALACLNGMQDDQPVPIIFRPDDDDAFEAFGQSFRARAFGRNKWIVDNSDILVAFFVTNEPSGGTLNTLNHARRKGIPIYFHLGPTDQWVKENV
jgi:predicted Rossmann fold nucleotide-binding protein DprA/Smf involved in DNA uptake